MIFASAPSTPFVSARRCSPLPAARTRPFPAVAPLLDPVGAAGPGRGASATRGGPATSRLARADHAGVARHPGADRLASHADAAARRPGRPPPFTRRRHGPVTGPQAAAGQPSRADPGWHGRGGLELETRPGRLVAGPSRRRVRYGARCRARTTTAAGRPGWRASPRARGVPGPRCRGGSAGTVLRRRRQTGREGVREHPDARRAAGAPAPGARDRGGVRRGLSRERGPRRPGRDQFSREGPAADAGGPLWRVARGCGLRARRCRHPERLSGSARRPDAPRFRSGCRSTSRARFQPTISRSRSIPRAFCARTNFRQSGVRSSSPSSHPPRSRSALPATAAGWTDLLSRGPVPAVTMRRLAVR